MENKLEKPLVISYMTLRKTIGILGIALPFVLWLGALLIFQKGIQSSISSYYHTGMRDVFVGTLWTIGFFLFSYKGYERRDDIAGNLACLFAVCVALFPTAPDDATAIARTVGYFHLAFAALFFFTLTYFCLFLFTKTDQGTLSKRKRQRNNVYKGCGYTMAACIVLMAIYTFLPGGAKSNFEQLNPIYWLEAFAILAFGLSWFTKGEAIFKDEE